MTALTRIVHIVSMRARGSLPVLLPLVLIVGFRSSRTFVGASAEEIVTGPHVGKCPVFPADNIWNTPVDKLPVHPRSAAYLRSIGLDKPLHPDFGLEPGAGLPYNLVPGSQRKVAVRVPP